MKYIVEVKEWENQQILYRNLGNNDALNFFKHAVRLASWGEKEELEEVIGKYLYERNPRNNNDNNYNKKCNPMLSIISALRGYERMVQFFKNTNPEKLKEFFNKD